MIARDALTAIGGAAGDLRAGEGAVAGTERCDALIVGGRVAGALTAARLAARGLEVVVLESQAFPSDTMSTHFFRGDGLVRSLQDVGVLDEVLATGAPPLCSEIFSTNGEAGREQPPQERTSVMACRCAA